MTYETVICERNWPKYFQKIKTFGKYWPKNPLSVGEDIKNQALNIPETIKIIKRAYSSVKGTLMQISKSAHILLFI